MPRRIYLEIEIRRFFDNWCDSLKWQRLPSYEKFAAMIEFNFVKKRWWAIQDLNL